MLLTNARGAMPVPAETAPHRHSTALMLQMLAWIDARPRGYGETMDAWRTSCPRLTVWEDAVDDGLVRIEATGTGRQADVKVRLTAHGAALLSAGA
jgi:hypothetical protein